MLCNAAVETYKFQRGLDRGCLDSLQFGFLSSSFILTFQTTLPPYLSTVFVMFFRKRKTGLEALLDRQRRRPSRWETFWSSPCTFLAHYIYTLQAIIHQAPANPLSVVFISDTHNSQPDLPHEDVFIHAGDLTQSGSLKELEMAITWLNSQPHPHKIVVAGNRDILLDKSCDRDDKAAIERKGLDWDEYLYLENDMATITCDNGRRLKIYGSPFSPRHGNWAFQYPRNQDVWSGVVPDDIDILVTRCPPLGHLDLMKLGCVHLLHQLWRIRPLLHVFGHIHEGYGQEWVVFDKLQKAYERSLSEGGV